MATVVRRDPINVIVSCESLYDHQVRAYVQVSYGKPYNDGGKRGSLNADTARGQEGTRRAVRGATGPDARTIAEATRKRRITTGPDARTNAEATRKGRIGAGPEARTDGKATRKGRIGEEPDA